MPDFETIDERQTPKGVFEDVFLQASIVVYTLSRLSKIRNNGTKAVPRTALRIGYASYADSDEGPVVLSTHLNVAQNKRQRPLVSVTDYFPSVPSMGQPFSVAAYTGREKYTGRPDFFIKQEKQSGHGFIVARLGATGVSSASMSAEVIGESMLDAATEFRHYPDLHRMRFEAVIQGIYSGLSVVEEIKHGGNVVA